MNIFNDEIKGLNKLTKGQQFFVKNFIEFSKELYRQGDKVLLEILELQNNNAEELLNLISKIMLKYNISDSKMQISLNSQALITKEIDKKINEFMKAEYISENTVLTKALNNVAKDKYNINSYLLSLGMDFSIKKISDKDLKIILNKTIDGQNYSNRIWNNREDIAKKLKVHIRDFLSGKINCNQIEKEIRDRFEVDKFYSKRMLRNEICRVQNDINEQFFEDNNAEYLLYSATLDSKTCSRCAADDGKVFRVDDPMRPELPRHVNDRCCYIQLPSKDYRPDFRIDNTTKENIEYKDYQEWAKENL
ncbi:minor capsid protein [Clostridium perfringens]|uniref:minor capsid protein n=1 Tax=Clostridium perfringens TaxID=1502 RepID=UPI001242F2F5|nr:minor capsid protein [Clostridium perfringens]